MTNLWKADRAVDSAAADRRSSVVGAPPAQAEAATLALPAPLALDEPDLVEDDDVDESLDDDVDEDEEDEESDDEDEDEDEVDDSLLLDALASERLSVR